MAKADYLIKLTYDKEYKGYVAECLNLYGCMSQGKTKEEALKNIDKAIKAYMEVVTKQDEGKQKLKVREEERKKNFGLQHNLSLFPLHNYDFLRLKTNYFILNFH